MSGRLSRRGFRDGCAPRPRTKPSYPLTLPIADVLTLAPMRIGFGAAAVIALVGAAALWYTGDDTTAGIAARVGAILAAIWIAWPVVSDVGRRSWWFAALSVLVILWRPRAAVVVLPVLAFALRRRDD